MIIKDIVTKRTYTAQGVEKNIWNKVGTLKDVDGRTFVELFMFPETPFYIFEQKKKEEVKPEVPVEVTLDDIVDSSAIPF